MDLEHVTYSPQQMKDGATMRATEAVIRDRQERGKITAPGFVGGVPPAPILAGILSVMAALQSGCLRYYTVRLVTAALRRTGRQSTRIRCDGMAAALPPGPGDLDRHHAGHASCRTRAQQCACCVARAKPQTSSETGGGSNVHEIDN